MAMPQDAALAVAGWRVMAASVAGASHERAGTPCEDAHAWRALGSGRLVAAVADGAGSASRAREGATIAADRAVEALSEEMAADWLPEHDAGWQAMLLRATDAARGALAAEAERGRCAPRDLATTLILLACAPGLVAVAHVGDGGAVVRDHAGAVSALTRTGTDGYVNETVFLTSADALNAAQFAVWRGEAAHVALFTDGLQMLALKMPAGAPHVPFFRPIFDFATASTLADAAAAHDELVALLRSPRIAARTDDDLTLLVAAREL